MLLATFTIGKAAGGFDHDINTELRPRQVCRVLFGEDLELITIDGQLFAIDLDRARKFTVNLVVFEQMRECRSVRQIVNSRNVESLDLQCAPKHESADTSKTIDTESNSHEENELVRKPLQKYEIKSGLLRDRGLIFMDPCPAFLKTAQNIMLCRIRN